MTAAQTMAGFEPQPTGLTPLDRELPLAERAYRAVREQIAAGALPPGQRLTERGLAHLLGVSPTPIREALRRLEQEGIIARSGPRTLEVIDHPDVTLRELAFAEAVLRAAEARIATTKIGDDAIARMTAAVERLARDKDATDEEVLANAAVFDRELVAAADNPALRKVIDSMDVVGRTRRVRGIAAMRNAAKDVGRRQLQAHRDILAAVTKRDADAVERLVREQLLASLEHLFHLAE